MSVFIQSKRRRFGHPVFLLAGLSDPVDKFVKNGLANDKRLPYAEYLSVQFPRGTIYSEPAALQLLRLLERQVKARQRSDPVVVTPNKIILIFERMKGDELLKKYFGFFAFPVGVDLAYGSCEGAHKGRRNPGFVLERFRSAVAASLSEGSSLRILEQELAFKYKRSLLLLPPQNFIDPTRKVPLERFFGDLWRGTVRWDHADQYLTLSQFKPDDFPYAPFKKQRLSAYSDSRALAFLPAAQEQWHAPPRLAAEELSVVALRTKLNELYRFGIPIHEGFHFDVQKRKSASLRRIKFVCAAQGRVEAVGRHINIYPNDYIRV